MLHTLSLISQFLVFIIFLVTIILFILWSIGNIKNKVPFVTSSKKVLKDIALALSINRDSVVYDLGCGDGRILFYLAKLHPEAKYIGIENNIFPFLLAKIGSFMNEKKTGNKVKIIYKNFWKQDLKEATHIFTYLYPNIMDDMLSKFDEELKNGTKLVSLSFKFTNKRPEVEIDLGRGKYKLGRKLYVYQF